MSNEVVDVDGVATKIINSKRRLQDESSCIALITVTHNAKKYLDGFFYCLSRQNDRNYKLIIIDNESSDGTLEEARNLIASYQIDAEIIENPVGLGIAVGNNQGIERARELNIKHLVLLNNDIGFDSSLIENIRKYAIKNEHDVWVCKKYYGDSERIWYGGGGLSGWRARGVLFNQSKSNSITSPCAVTFAPACLMYVNRSVFDRVGLLDPEYYLYYEDTDFCRRLLNANIQIIYDPSVSIKHYVGGSTGGDFSDLYIRLSTRNKLYYISKHYSQPRRMFVMGVAVVSKMLQMLSRKRRKATYIGLCDYFITRSKSGAGKNKICH